MVVIDVLLVIGAVLGGLGAFVGGTVAAVVAIRSAKKINAIDHAVNGKPKGAATIQAQVDDLHSDRPPPAALPPELNEAAIRDLLRYVAAEMHEQRRKK